MCFSFYQMIYCEDCIFKYNKITSLFYNTDAFETDIVTVGDCLETHNTLKIQSNKSFYYQIRQILI